MPSAFGHAAFACALGASARARVAVIAAAAACAVAPDLDVVAFRLGVPYASPLGHRGFTHSLAFALVLGASAALALRVFLRDAPRFAPTCALLALAAASHGLLDTLTDGGLGVALLWPVSDARLFAPWRPIAVSPLGVGHFLGGRGVAVLASEFTWIGVPSLILWGAARLVRMPRS
jgi:inner membrane protein